MTTTVLRRAASGGDPAETPATTNRRVRRLFVRRLIAGLTAVVAGGVGSFALANGATAAASIEPARVATLAAAPMVTPSLPGIPCRVTVQVNPNGNPQQYQARATITNKDSVASTG